MISFSKFLDPSKPIEERLFRMALLVTVGVMAFWLIVGVVFSYGWPVMTIYASSFLFFLTLLILFERGVNFKLLAGLYYIVGLLMLGLGWLPSGGVRGAVIHMFILIFVSGLLVLTRKSYLTFVICGVAGVIFFSYLELSVPGIAAPYLDEAQQILDLVIANTLLMALLGALLYYYKSEYLKDRKYIQGVNADMLLEKKRVEDANKSKSDFLATISHEMRTPLNGIIGITDLLSKTNTSSDQKELINHLEHSSVLLRSLISDVLDLTQIESNQLVLNQEHFGLKTELIELVDLCKMQISQLNKPVEIHFEYDESIPSQLVGDIGRLKQILLNLISNSIKFTDSGSIKVKAALSDEKLENKAKVHLSIKDSGVGISDEDKKRLFSKFFKARSNNGAEGSGLGLVISRSLAEKMGGAITMDSTLGVGTEFTATLAFSIGHAQDSGAKEVASNRGSFDALKLLLAEDVEVNRLVAIKMLNRLGITQIDIAVDGAEAVDLCTTRTYDIVLMDIKMPVMTGLEATQRILNHCAKSKSHNKPYIAALTANAFKEDIEACKEAGMNDFISKPFSIDELEQTLLAASEYVKLKAQSY